MLPTRFEVQGDRGVIGESGQGALRSVENALETLVDLSNSFLFLGRQCGVHVDVKVRIGNGANRFGRVVTGPCFQIFFGQAALERRFLGENDGRIVRAEGQVPSFAVYVDSNVELVQLRDTKKKRARRREMVRR